MTTETTARPTVRLYNGDCLEVLKTLDAGSVDAVVTDPPYGIKARTRCKSAGRSGLAQCNDFPPVHGDDKPFDPSPWLAFKRVVLFGANHYASRLPDSARWLVWDKRDGIPSNDNADCEMAWCNTKGPARLLSHRWYGMIKASEKNQKRVHPTQKPVALMTWILEQADVQPGMTVLDPFMGSGTTGVACVRAGINFIGCEIDPTYFATARRRIDEAAATLF